MFTSNTDNWATPQKFFDELNKVYQFELDPCADEANHKCEKYFTKEQNGLEQRWFGRVFCNPPYGKDIKKWVKKAHDSVKDGDCTLVVLLIPARTDTAYFHDYCIGHEVKFIKGRLKFGDSKNSAPFPSMLVIMV